MGVPLLKINGFDFSTYLDTQSEDGLDPLNPEYITPDFSGSPAFGEGKTFVAEAVDNRSWTVPLILSAANRASLHALVKQINAVLVRGATVEFAVDGSVDSINYFMLEGGRLDGKFEYMLSVHSTTRATLHIWTRPYATTGTDRLVASVPATGPQLIQVTGIDGDAAAQVQFNLRTASAIISQSNRCLVLYGLKYPAPSGWNPILSASAIPTSYAETTQASIVGASGRVASQYKGYKIGGIGELAFGQALGEIPVRSQDAGRYRLFFLLRHQITGGSFGAAQASAQFFVSQTGRATTVIPLASMTKNVWQLQDLGEVTIPETQPFQVRFGYKGASGASAQASHPIQIDSTFLVPVDQMVGIFQSDANFGLYGPDRWQFQFDTPSVAVRQWSTASNAFQPSRMVALPIANLRGDLPFLPPIPSGSPSGPAQLFTFSVYGTLGGSDDWRGNMPYDTEIRARERFSYLR